MPPRGGRGLTEDQKNENFNNFKAGEEYAQCEIIFKARTTEGHELKEMHPGTDDIIGDWVPVLNALFKLVEVMKVPGRKAKSYEQSMFRTMVFKRLQTDQIDIDGVTYEVSNAVNQDHFDCKEKFMNIIRHIEQGWDGDYLTAETLVAWKKELLSKLKEFEKKYVKHCKATNPFLAAIHTKSMQPVTDLMEASVNLQNFRILDAKKPFPEFRKKALMEKFIEHLTKVCDILKGFPNADQKTLDQEYDVRHILELLDIPNWQDIPPFKFYITPLKNCYDDLVNELKSMHKLGPLRVSYYCERNTEMSRKIMALMREYNIAKWLCGDELKRDQFKFMYDIQDKIYNSALRTMMLNTKNNQATLTYVVSELTVFKAMLLIRDIDDRKEADIVKNSKKKADRAAQGLSEEEEEELVLDIVQPVAKKGKKKVEIDPEVIEQARQKALFKKELAMYGRTWIWEGYYKEDEEYKSYWLAGAAALRRINPQVLEDIEDFLLLKGFQIIGHNGGGTMMSTREINSMIDEDLREKRAREKMEMAATADKDDAASGDPFEIGAIQDKKRNFITPLRPHKRIWNFIEDDEEHKVPHVLRATADPNQAYIDGRVADLLVVMEGLATHMRIYQQENWDHLLKQTFAIFKTRESKIQTRMEEYTKANEAAAQ